MKSSFANVASILIGALVVTAGILAYNFYEKNLRGIGPALNPPVGDIAESLNTTGLPLTLPPGYSISIFAKDLGDPRVLVHEEYGNAILVSSPSRGTVYALLPDGTRKVVADRLNKPHGLVVKCDVFSSGGCTLFVAETDRLVAFDYNLETHTATNKRKLVALPKSGNHTTRSLLNLHEGNELLVAIGSTCNVCRETDPHRAAIWKYDLNTGVFQPFARGLRNSVFLTQNPQTGKIWATEMGRDLLGDDLPPDEINIVEEGKNYGWPNCYGKNIHDTSFDKNTYLRNPCLEPFETPSHIDIPAHSAPLGLAFLSPTATELLVAYHGSWNRSVPTGYKIVKMKLDRDGNVINIEDFITGWLTKDGALGRPVDILVRSAKEIFISDDKAGVIYRLTR